MSLVEFRRENEGADRAISPSMTGETVSSVVVVFGIFAVVAYGTAVIAASGPLPSKLVLDATRTLHHLTGLLLTLGIGVMGAGAVIRRRGGIDLPRLERFNDRFHRRSCELRSLEAAVLTRNTALRGEATLSLLVAARQVMHALEQQLRLANSQARAFPTPTRNEISLLLDASFPLIADAEVQRISGQPTPLPERITIPQGLALLDRLCAEVREHSDSLQDGAAAVRAVAAGQR